jgi:hypothetical protein
MPNPHPMIVDSDLAPISDHVQADPAEWGATVSYLRIVPFRGHDRVGLDSYPRG